jgi:hypothetical protein
VKMSAPAATANVEPRRKEQRFTPRANHNDR